MDALHENTFVPILIPLTSQTQNNGEMGVCGDRDP